MSAVILHTQTLSPYGWTARMVCAEKGVACEVRQVADTGAAEHRALHPFGKIPVLQHGDILIYETLAIAHYIDRAFDGPALQPPDAMGQTDMLRWIGIVNSYAFPVMNGLIKARIGGMTTGAAPDEAALLRLRVALIPQIALIEQALAAHAFLAGPGFTLADAFLFPQLFYAAQTPEGVAALGDAPATRGWLEAINERPAVKASGPFATG